MPERLQKVLSRFGVASRRAAEAMISAGRVVVNGVVVDRPGVKVTDEDLILIDGKPLRKGSPRLYLALHKPRGYVTTMRDPRGRPTVKDLVAALDVRIYPVGRLDWDSEGLLIMTNDGEFAYRLQHPRYGVPKTYRVSVSGALSPGVLRQLRKGIELDDGPFRPRSVSLEKGGGEETWLTLTITGGRNRVIRRALAYLNHPVRRLIRTAVGEIQLGALPPGRYRELTDGERERMMKLLKIYCQGINNH